MKQEVLHDNLLKAIREKLPYEENLASVLGNLLCIGKEAIYRRLWKIHSYLPPSVHFKVIP